MYWEVPCSGRACSRPHSFPSVRVLSQGVPCRSGCGPLLRWRTGSPTAVSVCAAHVLSVYLGPRLHGAVPLKGPCQCCCRGGRCRGMHVDVSLCGLVGALAPAADSQTAQDFTSVTHAGGRRLLCAAHSVRTGGSVTAWADVMVSTGSSGPFVWIVPLSSGVSCVSLH